MKTHVYRFRVYYGRNMIGEPCHTYELREEDRVLYRLNNCLSKDGGENLSAVPVFVQKTKAIIRQIHAEDLAEYRRFS